MSRNKTSALSLDELKSDGQCAQQDTPGDLAKCGDLVKISDKRKVIITKFEAEGFHAIVDGTSNEIGPISTSEIKAIIF